MEDETDIIEKPKEKVVKDLKSYLSSFVIETNIEKYEYIVDGQFVTGIKLFVRVLGILKPVDVNFSELGFEETRLKVEDVDKIFKDAK